MRVERHPEELLRHSPDTKAGMASWAPHPTPLPMISHGWHKRMRRLPRRMPGNATRGCHHAWHTRVGPLVRGGSMEGNLSLPAGFLEGFVFNSHRERFRAPHKVFGGGHMLPLYLLSELNGASPLHEVGRGRVATP